MRNPHLKVINLIALVFVLIFNINCSKDSELFYDSILTEENSEDISTIDNSETDGTNDGFELRTHTFTAINDAFIQDDKGYDQNIVRLEENSRTSFLMFDLSPIDGEIQEAELQLYVDSDEGDGNINIHKGSSNQWLEESLSSTTAPTKEVQIGNLNKTFKLGTLEKVSVNTENIANEKNTLILTHENGNDLAFASKENSNNNGPKLVVTFKTAVDTPEIEITEEETTTSEASNPNPEPTPAPTPTTNESNISDGYYVTVNGSSSNDGLSEATAWSVEHAFTTAKAGDIVYIKAGNYGNKELKTDNSGTESNPIKFIGYSSTPGDIESNNGSTFNYGDQIDASRMPLFESTVSSNKTAISIHEKYIHLENIQITKYSIGIMVHTGSDYFNGKNLILHTFGNQSKYDAYDGWGLIIRSKNIRLEDSFVLNANAEAIKLFDSDNSYLTNCSVYGDNPSNPTDYYFIIAGGTNNALVENCHAERAIGLNHGGHGFNIKNDGTYNTFKDCTAVHTNFELTYAGVHHNTIDGGSITGIGTTSNQWHAVMNIYGGAHDNLIKDLTIENTWTAIALATYNDRSGADASLGINNTFENVSINNTNRILNIGGGTNFSAKAQGYTFNNCNFSDFENLVVSYYSSEGFIFNNCSFSDGVNFVTEGQGDYAPYSNFSATWNNCTWANISFNAPD